MTCDASQAYAERAGLTQVTPRATELLLGRPGVGGDLARVAELVCARPTRDGDGLTQVAPQPAALLLGRPGVGGDFARAAEVMRDRRVRVAV